jgi:biofilm PGA synthesis lipoprotein PgaB
MWKNYAAPLYIRYLFLLLLGIFPLESSFALVVLQYHHVSTDTPAATSVSPERFEQHMEWLAENEYQLLSMGDLIQLLRAKKTLPDKTAVITFDDGYTSIYTNAWPLLRKRNWPFTVFVNSQHHDENNRQYMSWEQLREMAKAGVTIGNHSVSHSHMIRRQTGEDEGEWLKRSQWEIEHAQSRIDAEVGRQAKIFAYPFGEHNRPLEALLRKLGYIAFAQHSGPVAAFEDLVALPRFPFGGPYGEIKDFALKVSSVPMPLEKITLLDEKKQPLADLLLSDQAAQASLAIKADAHFLKRISCFYGGESVVTEISGDQLLVSTPKAIPAGRSKFNCTAPEKGRFYWFSRMMIKKNADGSWYKE